jgi:hypothetical protein
MAMSTINKGPGYEKVGNETTTLDGLRLGRLPAKSTRKALMFGNVFADYLKFLELPKRQTYWKGKTPLALRDYGNKRHGCCTIAKQAVAAVRMERIEGRRTIHITDEDVLNRYYRMTTELYGGGDTGAYEDDALNRWRNPDLAVMDDRGKSYPIDAYLRINAINHDELRAALSLSGAKGLPVCLNLPAAFAASHRTPPADWALEGADYFGLTGGWMPGSWGGHSMWANGYTEKGIILDHTWELPNNLLTWDAAAAYLDEAHLVIDSVNAWRKPAVAAKKDKRLSSDKRKLAGKLETAIEDTIAAVNALSDIHIDA